MNSDPSQVVSRARGIGDLRRLIEFYLACVEAEDRRSLSLPANSYGRSYIAPWTGTEPLLHPAADEVVFGVRGKGEAAFLTSQEGQAGTPERFFYGFPVYVDANDYLAPLFILEVEIQPKDDGFRMLPVDPNALIINRHLLGLHKLPIEEQQVVEDMLQEPAGSFAARLAAVFEYLDQPLGALGGDEIEPFPSLGGHQARWINCPILFRSARSTFTDHLRFELSAFLRYPQILEQAGGTALAHFFRGATSASRSSVPLVEVVPLNPEQMKAASEALDGPLTVITGPPGTGKSQVVIDVLASCAAAGRAVLFCSKNNKAVDVVRDRLRELLGRERDWTLRLGNRHHMNAAKEEMTQRIDGREAAQPEPRMPDVSAWDRQVDLAYRVRDQLEKRHYELAEVQDSLRSAAERLPETWIDATPADFPHRLPLGRVTELRNRATVLSGQGRMGLWLWLARLLRPGWLWKHLRRTLEELCEAVPPSIAADIRETADRERRFRPLAEAFARLLAYEGWLTARDQLTNLESRLAQMPTAERLSQEIRDAKRAKAEASTAWLREAWTAHVTSQQQKVRDRLAAYFDQNEQLHGTRGAEFARRLDALTYTIRELGESLPIWIVTNLSARRSLPLKPAMFDLVVIDEASQCDIASALPLLFRTKRAVIIGDPHQLRHITMLPDREEQDLARRHQVVELLDDWSYNRQSLYDLAARTHRRSGGEPTFLREHFRSWPLIAEFSNRAVYQSRLRLRTDLRQLQDRLNGRQLGIVWHQVRGIVPSTQRSAGNPTEAKAVLELLQSWWDSGFLQRPDLRFGIVTPFRRQVEHIGDALRRQLWWEEIRGRLILGTAHQFQGDECDVMVFSPVVSAGMRENTKKWLTSTEHLLNVAITRARGVLHVVGDRQACEAAGGLLGEFSTYVNEMSAPPPSAAGNPIQTRMAELLAGSGLWYCPQFPVGRDRFDFLVVSPLGTRYDLEVDGRHHRTPEQIHADQVRDKRVAAAGYDVIRISARDLTAKPDRVQERIARLV